MHKYWSTIRAGRELTMTLTCLKFMEDSWMNFNNKDGLEKAWSNSLIHLMQKYRRYAP